MVLDLKKNSDSLEGIKASRNYYSNVNYLKEAMFSNDFQH